MGLAENIVLSFIKRGLNKALKLDDLPVISSDGLREYRDIPYRNRSDKELLMDIFEPVVAKGTELPVIVNIHGEVITLDIPEGLL